MPSRRISSEEVQQELERRGLSDPNELMTVDDDDEQVCRLVPRSEIRPMYVDNATTASPVQPDWLTLEFLNEPVTLGYSTGAQVTIKVGDISLDFSMPAEGYR